MDTGYQDFIKHLSECGKEIAVYGNGKLAKSIYQLLKRMNITISMFIVSKYDSDIREYKGIPVNELDSIRDCIKEYSCVLAVEDVNLQKALMDKVLMAGGESIVRLEWKLVQDTYANFCMDCRTEKDMMKVLQQENKIAIYGAGKLGKIIEGRLKAYGLKAELICVSKMAGNVESIDGTPVYQFDRIKNSLKGVAVITAIESFESQKGLITPLRDIGIENIYLLKEELIKNIYMNYRRDFLLSLEGYKVLDGFENIEVNHSVLVYENEAGMYRWRVPDQTGIPYNNDATELFQTGGFADEFVRQYGKCDYLTYSGDQLSEISEVNTKVEVYMARFYRDNRVQNYQLPDWVIPIQVGAALSDVTVADVTDNTGDNISVKNVDYSEGTALYWMWKNTGGQDYIGLFHYRRHMVFDRNSILRLEHYDAVLTLPTLLTENIYSFFTRRYILKNDWKLMMEAIGQYNEDMYRTALVYEKSFFYFPCNIFIMKRCVFDEMCRFIFNVLERVENFYQSNHIERKDRYLGYLIENLISIYIMHYSGNLKIACTDMKFYK